MRSPSVSTYGRYGIIEQADPPDLRVGDRVGWSRGSCNGGSDVARALRALRDVN